MQTSEILFPLATESSNSNLNHRLPCGTKLRLPRGFHMRDTIKRIFDLGASVTAVLVLSPVMLLIAFAIVCNSGGEVFFRQRREGHLGRHFDIIKYRSMRPSLPSDPQSTAVDDPRITKVGAFLRRASLDELPQLFNVIKGDMSLVGPRPLLPGTTRQDEMVRLKMRPGITGLAAVRGRQLLTWDERMALDCWYVENWTFSLDIYILWRTIQVVLSQEGVYDSSGVVNARS